MIEHNHLQVRENRELNPLPWWGWAALATGAVAVIAAVVIGGRKREEEAAEAATLCDSSTWTTEQHAQVDQAVNAGVTAYVAEQGPPNTAAQFDQYAFAVTRSVLSSLCPSMVLPASSQAVPGWMNQTTPANQTTWVAVYQKVWDRLAQPPTPTPPPDIVGAA